MKLHETDTIDTFEGIPGITIHNGTTKEIGLINRVKEFYMNETQRSILGPWLSNGSKIALLKPSDFQESGFYEPGIQLLSYSEKDGYDALIIKEVQEIKKQCLLTLGTTGSDCANIIIGSHDQDEIGIIHTGRKGLEEGLIRQSLSTFSDIKNCKCYVSPMIGDDEYTVDKGTALRAILGICDGYSSLKVISDYIKYYKKGQLRLRSLLKRELLRYGIQEENLFFHPKTTGKQNKWKSNRLGQQGANFIFAEID